MKTLPPLTRRAVSAAVRDFDQLGRDAFLSKYRFRKATTYFLVEGGKAYDAKAIVGAAYGFLPARRKPLKWHDFGSREATTKQWLEDLHFTVVERSDAQELGTARASERLDVGNLYTRDQLKKIFSTRDATIMTGVFRPPGFRSVFLFVTERKTADRTPFQDLLRGDTLCWQGQLSGRTDHLVTEHSRINLELLLFYRAEKYEYPGAAFRYEGIFRYESKRGVHPTSFILARQSKLDPLQKAEENAEQRKAFDPKDAVDARNRINATIVRRRGQPRFRAALMKAYGGRCALTGCDFPEVLEAAHIYPYRGDRTNDVSNGVLLRADIHTLFDLGWVTIAPKTHKIVVHPVLASTSYKDLHGKRAALPHHAVDQPSEKSLKWHLENSRARKALR